MNELFNEIRERLEEIESNHKQTVKAYQEQMKRDRDTIACKDATIKNQYQALTDLRKIVAADTKGTESEIVEAIKNEIRFLHKQIHCGITPQWDESIMCIRHIVHLITGKSPHIGVYKKREDETLGWPVPDDELGDWGL